MVSTLLLTEKKRDDINDLSEIKLADVEIGGDYVFEFTVDDLISVYLVNLSPIGKFIKRLTESFSSDAGSYKILLRDVLSGSVVLRFNGKNYWKSLSNIKFYRISV